MKKKATPSKKRPATSDHGDIEDEAPKKPTKKAKDKEPLSSFHNKVATAKGKKPPPPKEVGWFGLS